MNRKLRGRPDFLLLFLTVLLVAFGLVMIFSASSPKAIFTHDNSWHYVLKQGIFAGVGLFLMLIFMNIPYSIWKKAGPGMILFSFLLLVLVLLVGTNINGAKRWFVLGGLNIQPAEFTKLSIIVYLSTLISKKGEEIRSFKKGLLPLLIMVGLIISLIMMQPDFGTVLILAFIAGTIIMIGGVDLRHLFMLGLGLVPMFIYLAISQSYRLKRIHSFLNPFENQSDSGYQLIQSLYALGHGGLTGTGLGRSVQKLFYLPEAHTDFIFAVIGEELGIVGTTLFFIVFFLFFWRGFAAAIQSNDPFGMMLGMGLISMIGIQFLLNLGAATGSLPVTGVPLPFISYGGSSLVLCMASTGILLGISRDNNRRQKEELLHSHHHNRRSTSA
ncbi:putative lipid II flippase FtsW [Paenibacillus planticolens]|uniref:Probable peptidoglycan glycosyltransferase FtsW n=1 Tax=Paenibacillus planticolens TaxID=2654976 RepID=A0ABX1ZLJ3_9BACL|nr:putative lipid II flippase FtsW [Paenibacillus planticolens]NOU99628.1 putative lipid II flippase FtsW [Paenibacillus planticolens]